MRDFSLSEVTNPSDSKLAKLMCWVPQAFTISACMFAELEASMTERRKQPSSSSFSLEAIESVIVN